MSIHPKTIGVIGDGGWGTTLALHCARNGHSVTLWGPFPDYVKRMQKARVNPTFLPGVHLPKSIHISENLTTTIAQNEILLYAIPSQFTPAILKQIAKTKCDLSDKIILSVTKGIDTKSLKRISQMIHDELGDLKLGVLSGPTIAKEVAAKIPSTAVIASSNQNLAKTLQQTINSDTFRIYTNTDIIGVELGGSIKNVIALACGVCDGLGFGSNTKAALLTRGLAEMARLGVALGGKKDTFSGLSGLGDLVTTCFAPTSRNRTVGEQLGKGKTIESILSKMRMVAEGVETSKAIVKISKEKNIPMPICTEVYNIIFKHKQPAEAVADLMTREVKKE
ncbi:MAG: NAD(P)-dependent glycerol-3-phosphate dehydrogenase [Candidatus Omnitrophica bacterium]|nr:NAD(P)-dependent glycerol-3-phosphate dehydrogenase [Candidatus Omnitrophota bacterium]